MEAEDVICSLTTLNSMLKGLSLERLRTLQSVADAGGFSEAAEGDEIRATMFARQVRELESHFGVQLYNRAASKFELTLDGERLTNLARQLHRGLDDLRAKCEAKPLLIRIGAGDRLLHWLVIPHLAAIQRRMKMDSQIQLHNCSTRQVLERIHLLTLDIGVVRATDVPKNWRSVKRIPSRFTYSLFASRKIVPSDFPSDATAVLKTVPLALVERYQSEFEREIKERRIDTHVRLLCSTFPQARRAVVAGYAAILPTAAFSADELDNGVVRYDLPFRLPQFEREESVVAVVWNRKLESLVDQFDDILNAFVNALSVK